ncbi:MAG: TauD/TfdA family dioxygenase [Asticcacaulis sp.]
MNAIVRDIEAAPQTAGFTSRKLARFIGSEVSGLDLKAPLDTETVAALRALLLARGVLVFRDQFLSPEQQIAFTRYFGHVNTDRPARGGAPLPGIGVFDSRNELAGRVARWHADGTHAEAPGTIKTLQPTELPEIGGDTIWASVEAAYDRLSPPLQRLAESLTAIHATTPLRAQDWPNGFGGEFIWSEHPVVVVHPETGRKSLFVSQRYTPEIKGVRPNESAAILKILFDHIALPEHQVRVQWAPGTIVLWDNRTSQHYAVNDYDDDLRIVHSVSVQGEPRTGVVGQKSKLGAVLKTADLV